MKNVGKRVSPDSFKINEEIKSFKYITQVTLRHSKSRGSVERYLCDESTQ